MINSGIAVVLGTIIVFLIVVIKNINACRNITVKLFHKTPNTSIWFDVFDFKRGSNLKVYLKDKDYYVIGSLKNFEVNVENPWLVLNSFAKFDVETNENYKNEPSYLDRTDILIAIRFPDIDHIEIFLKYSD